MKSSTRFVELDAFAPCCADIVDEVVRTNQPVTITRDGRPLVEVIPTRAVRPLTGSVTFLVDDEALIAPCTP